MKNKILKRSKKEPRFKTYQHEIDYYQSTGLFGPADIKKLEKHGFFKFHYKTSERSVQEIVAGGRDGDFVDVEYMLKEIEKAQKNLKKANRRASSNLSTYYAERLAQIDQGFSRILKDQQEEYNKYYDIKNLNNFFNAPVQDERTVPFSNFDNTTFDQEIADYDEECEEEVDQIDFKPQDID